LEWVLATALRPLSFFIGAFQPYGHTQAEFTSELSLSNQYNGLRRSKYDFPHTTGTPAYVEDYRSRQTTMAESAKLH